MQLKYLLLLLVFFSTLTSCSDKNQRLVAYEFVSTPTLGIENYRSKDKEYSAEFNIAIKEDTSLVGEGIVFLRQNTFYGRLPQISSNSFVLFDLLAVAGTSNQLTIEYINNSGRSKKQTHTILCEKVVPNYNLHIVRKFKILDYWGFQNDINGPIDYFDLVVFVTKENGVIGSYLIAEQGNKFFYIAPRGDILETVLDYSKMELRTLR